MTRITVTVTRTEEFTIDAALFSGIAEHLASGQQLVTLPPDLAAEFVEMVLDHTADSDRVDNQTIGDIVVRSIEGYSSEALSADGYVTF